METVATTKSLDIPALITRAKLVTLSPKQCWQTISRESPTQKQLLQTYIIPLTIAGIVCSTIGMQVFGMNMGPLGTWRPPFIQYLISQVVFGIVGIFMLFLASLILQKLAPFFQGSVTAERAFSLLAHCMLPMLLSNLLTLFPLLGIFGIVFTIISLSALYHGIPTMTTVTSNKALGFAAAFIVTMMLVSIVVFSIAGALLPLPQPHLPSL